MVEVIRLLCDKCGDMNDVGPYRLSTPETGLTRGIAIDLCGDCAAPLKEVSEFGRPEAASRLPEPRIRAGRSTGPRARIYSQDEIDAIEQEEGV